MGNNNVKSKKIKSHKLKTLARSFKATIIFNEKKRGHLLYMRLYDKKN